MTDLRIDTVRDPDTLVAMAREWDALVQRAGIDHPFLGHDWVRTWWECFGAHKELCVLAVRAGDALIALAPLMRTRVHMYAVPVWRLEFISNVHTPRFDVIVAERADEVYPALVDHLQSQEARWDILMLPELPENSRTERELSRLARSRSLRTGTWVAGASPRIPLVGDFDAFVAALSSKRRSSLRRRLRQLESLGKVSLEVVTDVEHLASTLGDGLRIEAAAWKGEAGTAIVRNPDIERFYELIAERAARSGTLRLLFLKVGDKRIAFGYCLRHGPTLYLLKTGYDPEYATYGPFHTLMFRAVEAAFAEGFTTIDLLGSDEPWKREWTDEHIERRWCFLYRDTLRGRFVHFVKFTILPWLRRSRLAVRLAESFRRGSARSSPKLAGAQP